MAKRDLDKKVSAALRALTADKEDAIRSLVVALDNVATIDAKMAALNASRSEAIRAADEAHTAAKVAGWKAKDLSDAGLVVPRSLELSALSREVGEQATTNDEPADPEH